MSLSKKFKCLIVDDEPPAREVLRRYISELPMLELCGECGNAMQALAFLQQQKVDLLFLDIQMPQISGIDLIGTLKQPPKILLTTAFDQYAVQAFELDVTDYLVKPIQFDRFLKAVMKALPEHEPLAPVQTSVAVTEPANLSFLYFRADRKMVKVFLNEILYIESLKDYVKINTTRGTVVTKHAITALEAMLPETLFIRVHRSFIVALDKIDSFTKEEIDIQQNIIPIGKVYRRQVLKDLKIAKDF